MVDRGKRNVVGVLVDAIDRDAAVAKTIDAAREGRPFAISALAVHGVMTGRDPVQRGILNDFDVLAPDGQPVRWALNLLYRSRLRSTVRGTDLTLGLIAAAEENDLPVYFYGSRQIVLDALLENVRTQFPRLRVAGSEPSRFRSVSVDEQREIAARIRATGARIVFVGLGCPRQEVFAHTFRNELSMPLVAIGAAFDYIAGFLRQPPAFVQRSGLEWFWRLSLEPSRLWRRYAVTNPAYLTLLALQAARVWRPATAGLPVPAGSSVDA